MTHLFAEDSHIKNVDPLVNIRRQPIVFTCPRAPAHLVIAFGQLRAGPSAPHIEDVSDEDLRAPKNDLHVDLLDPNNFQAPVCEQGISL